MDTSRHVQYVLLFHYINILPLCGQFIFSKEPGWLNIIEAGHVLLCFAMSRDVM